MRAILFILALLFTQVSAKAQQYNINSIDPSLMLDANVVVRLEEQNIIIKDEGHAVITHKYAYTILNAGGDVYADFAVTYDKLKKVSAISGGLFSADGTKIRSLKKNDLKDYSNTSESTLADDDRVKTHSFNNTGYPYSIEYESTEEFNGLFYLPAWIPVFDENVSVEKSVLTVQFPQGYKLRFKSFNTSAPEINTLKSVEQYQWYLEKYKAISYEAFMPSWHEITPAVFLAPSGFEIQKFKGSMNNWKEFGTFLYKLNEGRDQLPANIKAVVHNLTDQLRSPLEKINALYKYLQQNTRYISIQFGIGGWQTLDATFVAGNGYGDCKALTNYMYSLLKEAGIKSFYTLVKSGVGSTDLLEDFSCNQFDHVILCVPMQKDTTWLECTSQTLPTGYLSSFTSNRPVLLVDESGGIPAKTPVYSPEDNLQVRNINATLDVDGLLTATVNTTYRAEQQDELQGILHGYSKEKIAEYIKTKFALPTYETGKYSFDEVAGVLPVIREEVLVKAKNYASVSGKRLFVSPNVLSVSEFKITNASTRKYDFDMQSAFTDFDTVSIIVPKGFVPESVPPDVSIEMPLAKYKSTVKISGDKIFYTRSYTQAQGKIPASGARNMAEFFEKIYKADHSKIVFIREVLP